MEFFIAVAAVIVAFIAFSNARDLDQRLRKLEARLAKEKLAPDAGAEASSPPSLPDSRTPWPTATPITRPEQRPEPPDLAKVPPMRPLPEPVAVAAAPRQDQPLVFTEERYAHLLAWLRSNWIYVVSAVSLALAGLFLVQYGMENGLLPPELRVLASFALGLGLTVAGERLRRRYGTRSDGAGQVPTTFSAAGLVAMFGAVIAARGLYELIGAELAFALLLAVSAYAVFLGWINGAFLTAFGLIGAAVSPFLAGGDSVNPLWLNYHYVLIAGVGLSVDTIRRWAWISVLALVIGYGGIVLTLTITDGPEAAGGALLLVLALALTVPERSLWPRHGAPSFLTYGFGDTKGGLPAFPVRLAAGAMVATTLGLFLLPVATVPEAIAVFVTLAALAGAFLLYGPKAPGITDLGLVPLAAFVARILTEMMTDGPLADLQRTALLSPVAEAIPPLTITLLLGLTSVLALIIGWRARSGNLVLWGGGAALLVSLVTGLLHVVWTPEAVYGASLWATHVMAMAGLMTVLAVLFARAGGDDLRPASYATLAALALIALALFVLLTANALTLALAVLVVVAVLLDRRFNLRELSFFIQAGVLVLGYRLTFSPGVLWAYDAPLGEVWLVWGGTLALMTAALLLQRRERLGAAAFLESGVAGGTLIFAEVLVLRWLEDQALSEMVMVRAAIFPALVFMGVQLYRLKLPDSPLRILRIVLAVIGGILALIGDILLLTYASPLQVGRIDGVLLLDTLTLVYLMPGLLLLAAPYVMVHLHSGVRRFLTLWGGVLASVWVLLEIRHVWQGDELNKPGVLQGELYTYTIAMMIAGGLALLQAIRLGSREWRLGAMALIVVTIAKVFLLDAAGLTGLTRVASFLGLGLALAAVAWLNRWAAQGEEDQPEA